jgi:hypothetical protein
VIEFARRNGQSCGAEGIGKLRDQLRQEQQVAGLLVVLGGFPVSCYHTTLDVKRKAREGENAGARSLSVEAIDIAPDYLAAMLAGEA